MHALSEEPVGCPFCGERITIVVDHSLGDQQYVEDCEVCCRPVVFAINIDESDSVSVVARYEGD